MFGGVPPNPKRRVATPVAGVDAGEHVDGGAKVRGSKSVSAVMSATVSDPGRIPREEVGRSDQGEGESSEGEGSS
jgi:hypothetical protein